METALAIFIVIGIFIAIPAVIGFAIVGIYAMRARRAERKVPKGLDLLGNRTIQWIILVFLCIYYPIIYYFGELVDHFGWESLHWEFFYTVHDIHRVVFLVPILFASYYFRIKGAIFTTVFALAVFLPRGILLSPYPDPVSRMTVFIIFALLFGIFVGALSNKVERLQKAIDSDKK
jgi:integral membrane sensor domain MASE1